jgi:hypothetical protein
LTIAPQAAEIICPHLERGRIMKDKTAATFSSRSADVREIAKGIFDYKERRTVLKLVAEYEKFSKAMVARSDQKTSN